MINRKSIRALLFTPQADVLLMQIENPSNNTLFWITPGDGIENDENATTCLKRELLEETGRSDFIIGPHIWNRCHVFEWNNEQICQNEEYYFVQVEKFIPQMKNNPSETELMVYKRFKWWKVNEILCSEDLFAPRELGAYIQDIIVNGRPKQPITVAV